VLAVDDLHWVDRPSLRFLAYLTQRLEGLPILVASSLRTGDEPADPALVDEIAHDPATVSIHPRPLTEAAVREIVRERLGPDADEDFCRACHRATLGNPLLLRQILTALEADAVPPDSEHAHVVREIGQGAVSRSVLLRLSRLGADATAVARAVAVLGENAELPAIAALAEIEEKDVAEVSAALARAEILRPERPPGFVHPLLRDAVYHDMPLAQRELLHTNATRILTDLNAPAEQIAAHLLAVPRRNSPWVGAILQQAAIEAGRKGAADSAVAYLRRALDEPPPPSQRGRLLIDLGMAEWFTNGPSAAEHLEQGYALLEDPVERATAAEVLGRALLFTARPEAAAAIARQAIADLPPGNDDLRDRLDAFLLVTVYFGVSAIDELERLHDFEPPPPDAPVGRKMLAATAALTSIYRGDPVDDAVALSAAAFAGGELLEADNGLLSTSAIITLTLADRYDESLSAWEAATADGHRRGSLFAISSIHLWRGFTYIWRGDLLEAEDHLDAAWASFDLFGYGFHAGAYRSAFQAWIKIERGKVEEARAALAQGEDYGGHGDGLRWWLETQLQLLVAEGRYEEAVEAADEIARRFPHTSSPPASRWRPFKAEALDALGRRDEALAVAREELELARRSGSATGVGRALRVLGTIEGEDGFASLYEAVDVLAAGAGCVEHAKALLALGTRMRLAGLPQEAAGHLAKALELAEVRGADGLAARVREELAEIGVDARIEAPSGRRALTETERRVAALAAEGQTAYEIAQALFVTPNTIDTQLGGVFRKLGISSHEELAPALTAD
jgi:DNA-binding CsgD family transcriptional regulator